MDLEEAVNASSSSTSEIQEYSSDFYERLFLELFTLVGLTSLAANILIIYTILKFKKLRQETTNIILVHLNLLEGVFLLVGPLTFRVCVILFDDSFARAIIVSLVYIYEFVVSIAICLFMVLLICDWYLKTYNEIKYVKFSHVYKFFITAIYILIILCFVIVTQLCIDLSSLSVHFVTFMVVTLAMIVCYCILSVFLIIMNIVHLVKKRRLRENKHNLGLIVTNIFFLFWIPSLILVCVAVFYRERISPAVPVVIFTIGHISPVFTLLYLFYYVDAFNVCFKKILMCHCNDYRNELLEDGVVSFSNENGVTIVK